MSTSCVVCIDAHVRWVEEKWKEDKRENIKISVPPTHRTDSFNWTMVKQVSTDVDNKKGSDPIG